MTDYINALKAHINGGRLFHAYIISGSSEEGRMTAARYIAKTAVCENENNAPCSRCRHCVKADKGIHPDITVLEREKDAKELTVDAMRAVRAAASVVPNEADKSVYIIRDADTMNISAQNAMLKVFEEPPGHAVFVLLAANPERLLPTVRSRCEMILLPPEDDTIDSPEAQAIFKCAVSCDDVGLVREILGLEKLGKDEILNALAAMRREAVKLMQKGKLTSGHAETIIKALDDGEKYMAVNVSSGYISGLLLAAFTEK